MACSASFGHRVVAARLTASWSYRGLVARLGGVGEDTVRDAPSQRREQIRSQVLHDGFARIEELARSSGVSAMTVHRDLDLLAAEGWLTKIRGGATANPSALLAAGVRERMAALATDKAAIAACAARLLGPGQTVFLDDSTTALALVPHLLEAAPLTVATNFLPVVQALAGAPDVEVILLGGQYSALQEACFGLGTVEAVRQLHADLMFLSTTAVVKRACYHRSESTVLVKRALMAASARKVLLVDHAKFGRPAPHLLARVQDFDVVVTDSSIDPTDLAELRELDVQVELAPSL